MTEFIKGKSPFGRKIQAVAGSALKVGDRVTLVIENSPTPGTGGSFMVAYRAASERGFHGTATSAAEIGETVDIVEAVIQDVMLPIDFKKDFTPIPFDDNHYLFLHLVDTCPICGRKMMSSGDSTAYDDDARSQKAQMERAGIVARGSGILGEYRKHICEVCTKEGKGKFTCAMCDQTRTSDQLHDTSFGEPICTICYTTLTAEQYDQKYEAIGDAHQWD